jgi:hypothetical protein
MANDTVAPVFMDLPLEVRHCIFEYAAARDAMPKKLLRYWFEKKEVKESIAQLAVQDPNGPTPRVHWSDDREYGDESDVGEEEDEEAEGAEEQDSEDEENEGEAEQDEDGEEDGEDEEEPAEQDQEAEVDEEEEEGDALDGAQVNLPAAAAQVSVPAPAQPTSSAQATTPVDEEEQAEDEMEVDAEEVQDEEQEDEAETQDTQADVEQESEDDDEGEDEEMGDGNGNADSTAAPPQQPPRPAPVVQAHRKWRHIPNFMRLTQCPPPVELLLTSQQLNTEAKNWFYDVAVLRIDATGSFAHTSFFEEAFSQITDSAFSPLENIRKVEVTFVWDSTWVRSDTSGCVGAIFPALLGQRSSFVYQILSQAPDLKEVVIHW